MMGRVARIFPVAQKKACGLCGETLTMGELGNHLSRCGRISPEQRLRDRLRRAEEIHSADRRQEQAKRAFFFPFGLSDHLRQGILREVFGQEAEQFLASWEGYLISAR